MYPTLDAYVDSANGLYQIAGQYVTAGVASVAIAIDTIWAIPYVTGREITIDQLVVNVSTAKTSAVIRLGIYDDSGQLAPNSLVLDGGAIDASSTGIKTAGVSQKLLAGKVYWFAAVAGVSALAPYVRGLASSYGLRPLYHILDATTDLTTCYTASFAYGSLPSTFPTPLTEIDGGTRTPLIGMRVAS